MDSRDFGGNYWRLSVVSVGIALFATMVSLAAQSWFSAKQHLLDALQTNAQIFGANASAALAFGDAETAKEILSALTYSPMVVEAALYLPNGQKLAGYKSAGSRPAYAPATLNVEDGLLRTSPGLRQSLRIRMGDTQLGGIVLWAVMDSVYAELRNFLLGFSLTAGVAGLLAYLAGYRLRQRLAENQRDLESSAETIRRLAARRDQLMEEEHKRIAREIHDELGQTLTTALMGLKRISQKQQCDVRQIADIEAAVASAMRSVRDIAADLRPAVLNIGFQAAIEWLAERTLADSGIRFQIRIPESALPLNEEAMTALFRIIQESLTNVVRHAQAGRVTIALAVTADRLVLSIEDDGVGFTPSASGTVRSLGLIGMKERAAALGATLTIVSNPGQGTRISVTLALSNH